MQFISVLPFIFKVSIHNVIQTTLLILDDTPTVVILI